MDTAPNSMCAKTYVLKLIQVVFLSIYTCIQMPLQIHVCTCFMLYIVVIHTLSFIYFLYFTYVIYFNTYLAYVAYVCI